MDSLGPKQTAVGAGVCVRRELPASVTAAERQHYKDGRTAEQVRDVWIHGAVRPIQIADHLGVCSMRREAGVPPGGAGP